MDTAMDNRTNKNISSKNKKKRIVNNVLMVFNILLLIAAVVIAAMVLTGCSKEPDNYPEAEALVAKELDAIKTADHSDESLKVFTQDVEGELDGTILEGYIEKLQEFDYEILESSKIEDEDNSVNVKVRITTYDFANAFLKTWNDHMSQEETNRWQSQFYSFLLLRLASVSTKDHVSDVDVVCVDEKGDGNWTTDLKSNEELMDAIAGGMLSEIKNLMSDDVVMDEDEVE